MTQRRSLDAVFFDVGGTLLRVEPSVGEVYASAAREHGFEADPHEILRRFRLGWKQSLERSRARGHATSDGILREEWRQIVALSFGELVPPRAFERLFEDLYERFVSAEVWHLHPGIRDVLELLRQAGVRVGVVSNWDSRLERLLQELDLTRELDFVVASHAIGFEKPHPRIFEEALRRAGSAPGRTLHVGDSFFADISPALKLGLQTLWIASEEERAREGYAGPGLVALPGPSLQPWEALVFGEPYEHLTGPESAGPHDD